MWLTYCLEQKKSGIKFRGNRAITKASVFKA